MEALNIDLDMDSDQLVKSIEEHGFGFIFAPRFHPSLRHVGPVRKKLAVRTIFNILGPLVNPSPVKRQVIGVYDQKYHHVMAEVLKELGSEEVMLVTGKDGLDEISLVDETFVTHLKDQKIFSYVVRPEDFLMERCQLQTLKVGTPLKMQKYLNESSLVKKGLRISSI